MMTVPPAASNTVKLFLMPRPKGSHLKPRPLAERIGCIALPAVGLLLCALYAYLILWRPARIVIDARDWNAVPCRIVSSEVVRVPVTGGRTIYKLDIRYQYSFEGRSFTSNRFDAIGDSGSGGYESKQRTVARYPAGTMTTCYVDPEHPGHALIDRGLPARMWWGAIPVLGMLLCLPGLLLGLAMARYDVKA